MDSEKSQTTLGRYLEKARQDADLTIRQLAAASDIPQTSLVRLLKDDVEMPSPDNLMSLAEALDVKASDLFLLASLPIPHDLPSVDAMLRQEYGLSEEGLAEAKRQIASIAEKERKNIN
jgi:transcriptional regulator with XRE-family HTH domain